MGNGKCGPPAARYKWPSSGGEQVRAQNGCCVIRGSCGVGALEFAANVGRGALEFGAHAGWGALEFRG